MLLLSDCSLQKPNILLQIPGLFLSNFLKIADRLLYLLNLHLERLCDLLVLCCFLVCQDVFLREVPVFLIFEETFPLVPLDIVVHRFYFALILV